MSSAASLVARREYQMDRMINFMEDAKRIRELCESAKEEIKKTSHEALQEANLLAAIHSLYQDNFPGQDRKDLQAAIKALEEKPRRKLAMLEKEWAHCRQEAKIAAAEAMSITQYVVF